MNRHRLLRQLIADDMYVVDAVAVADAILARSSVRASVASAGFRSEAPAPVVRSFRRDNHARSFRLERRDKLNHLAN